VPSIIITLATLNIYQGLLTGLSGGRWIYELPERGSNGWANGNGAFFLAQRGRGCRWARWY
jgi:ribose/xylose/arabinose/galactoside ABC-type transport system permease subunit